MGNETKQMTTALANTLSLIESIDINKYHWDLTHYRVESKSGLELSIQIKDADELRNIVVKIIKLQKPDIIRYGEHYRLNKSDDMTGQITMIFNDLNIKIYTFIYNEKMFNFIYDNCFISY
jgi:hypothetical protein